MPAIRVDSPREVIHKSPLVKQMVDDLVANLPKDYQGDHTHWIWVRKPWWRRLWAWISRDADFDDIRAKHFPCSGRLVPDKGPKVRTELEPERLGVRVTAWMQYRCEDPSISPSEDWGHVIRYAAGVVSCLEIDRYRA